MLKHYRISTQTCYGESFLPQLPDYFAFPLKSSNNARTSHTSMLPKASALASALLTVCFDIHWQGLLQLAADMAQHTSDFKA